MKEKTLKQRNMQKFFWSTVKEVHAFSQPIEPSS